MNAFSFPRFFLTLALIGGCQNNLDWTPLDGWSTDLAGLEKARKTCHIEIKLSGLERAQQERDKKLGASSTNQLKMLAKDDYEQIKRQVYREIDSCMQEQGYKR